MYTHFSYESPHWGDVPITEVYSWTYVLLYYAMLVYKQGHRRNVRDGLNTDIIIICLRINVTEKNFWHMGNRTHDLGTNCLAIHIEGEINPQKFC